MAGKLEKKMELPVGPMAKWGMPKVYIYFLLLFFHSNKIRPLASWSKDSTCKQGKPLKCLILKIFIYNLVSNTCKIVA